MARPLPETLIGVGTLVAAAGLMAGATQIPSEAGYGGVGPNFLPWVVGALLAACGAFLLWEARTGGFRQRQEPSGSEHGDWGGFVWVSGGLLLNAALITTLGFILSCALCFVFAVRGFQRAEGRPDLSLRAWLRDLAIGIAISGPVFWMFTQLLAINLPGLTSTGWI